MAQTTNKRTRKVSMDSPIEDDVVEEEGEVEEVETEEDEDTDSEEIITAIDELDPDTEIFEGGPTAGDIARWKDQYGNVYLTAIDYDEYIIWRPITRREYRDHIRSMSEDPNIARMSEIEANLHNEETIFKLCSLYPTIDNRTLEDYIAGVPALITQQVMEASGFTALEVRQL